MESTGSFLSWCLDNISYTFLALMHPSSITMYLVLIVACAHFIDDDDESDDVTPSVVIAHE